MTGTGTQTQKWTTGVTTIALLVLRTGELKMVCVIQKTHVTNKGPQKLMTIQMSEFFNVPLIASSYGGVDLGLKSHMKEA